MVSRIVLILPKKIKTYFHFSKALFSYHNFLDSRCTEFRNLLFEDLVEGKELKQFIKQQRPGSPKYVRHFFLRTVKIICGLLLFHLFVDLLMSNEHQGIYHPAPELGPHQYLPSVCSYLACPHPKEPHF